MLESKVKVEGKSIIGKCRAGEGRKPEGSRAEDTAPSISSLETLVYRALHITTSAGHGLLAAAQ